MNVDQKLTAIRDLIQHDVGNRGLARDPKRNLINACPQDFANACASIAEHPKPRLTIVTGFMIPLGMSAHCGETDGPLGALFIAKTLAPLNIDVFLASDDAAGNALRVGLAAANLEQERFIELVKPSSMMWIRPDAAKVSRNLFHDQAASTHLLAIERVGPSHATLASVLAQRGNDSAAAASFAASVPESVRGHRYTMRGRIVDHVSSPAYYLFERSGDEPRELVTIGIGDGGNEIGMGKIPWDTIRRNVPNGALIACRVPTDQLIVAGVSNWGAYALSAGVALLRGVELPAELFDPDRERELLQVMVDAGPLVDGVTGKQEATVDGLSWDDYIKPLVEIGKIMRA
jgi:D-glutamate cyclase